MVLPRTIKNTPSSTAPQWLRDLVGNTSFLGGTSPTYSPQGAVRNMETMNKNKAEHKMSWCHYTPILDKTYQSMKLPNHAHTHTHTHDALLTEVPYWHHRPRSHKKDYLNGRFERGFFAGNNKLSNNLSSQSGLNYHQLAWNGGSLFKDSLITLYSHDIWYHPHILFDLTLTIKYSQSIHGLDNFPSLSILAVLTCFLQLLDWIYWYQFKKNGWAGQLSEDVA